MRCTSEVILINVGLQEESVKLDVHVVWRSYIPPPLVGSAFAFEDTSRITHRVNVTKKIINSTQLSSLLIETVITE